MIYSLLILSLILSVIVVLVAFWCVILHIQITLTRADLLTLGKTLDLVLRIYGRDVLNKTPDEIERMMVISQTELKGRDVLDLDREELERIARMMKALNDSTI